MILNSNTVRYSGGAAAGARARAAAEEGREEGAHCERRCERAARNPMISAHLRIAGDLSYKDHPSLPTSALPGRCAVDHNAERQRA